MTATIIPFGPFKMVYEVPCASPTCKRTVRLRTPSRDEIEAFCSPGCARAKRPEWFKTSIGGDAHG